MFLVEKMFLNLSKKKNFKEKIGMPFIYTHFEICEKKSPMCFFFEYFNVTSLANIFRKN
jgi:hypothetical protein